MLLLQALTLQTERFRNLKKLVADILGIEVNLKFKDGVENIIKELDKLYKEFVLNFEFFPPGGLGEAFSDIFNTNLLFFSSRLGNPR